MGRFVIITGGSTGIGRQLVQAFAGLGDTVAFSYLGDDAPAKSLVSLMEQQGRNVLALSADVGDGDTVEQFFNQACAWAKASPAVLINNAGVQTWSSLLDLSEKDWNRVIRTNLTGTFLNTKAAASRMVAAGNGGAIVNIGSGCNKLAFPNLVDYTASKGGVEQFTKVAAVELGPHGIRVNCVAPGAIATERTYEEAPDYGEVWGKVTPLRRVGIPQDIAGPVLYLASDAAGFVTGQTLWVDGGLFTRPVWPYE
ncbi:SDR family oxidoreductase [Agrobacterium vitis]|uniref:SDR family NAD(P)-dependent oxidoreductase n=1 Tax=Rhizobium/Agrobacterium group TaxID=227290 RepID=UPI0008DC0719|nr:MULTISPECIES: SDR family oxidoreductase [Rhizobium/Agrobacterium group]MCF1435124.1 SDR family oxidoreductase [Allorhizobium ampelinum]MUO90531.1 SDR family oxidoreductase [Agrobacterium vitis]MUZ52953.1 SDR family oxidoreductase [Agrobacterium vitis]MUZ91172.1 SDR family oxidoreductase [Agrobacterium vitis]MVA40385.1 SDR family oxidoreductase [Agrobacterium vitis]